MSEIVYCFWDVRTTFDLVITCVHLVISIVLMCFILKTCCRSKRYFEKKSVFILYIFLSLWSISYVAQYIFGIAIYAKLGGDLSNLSSEQFAMYSSIFEFMDFVTVFLLLGCIFFISSHLYTITLQGSFMTERQKKIKKFLIAYQFLRLILFVPTLCLLFLGQTNTGNANNLSLFICSSIYLLLYFVDFIICSISVWHVSSTMRQKSQEPKFNANDQDIKKLRWQTKYLKLMILIRLLYGLVFALYNSVGNFFINDDCRKDFLFWSIFYLLIGQFVFHIIPVVILLYIFKIQKKQKPLPDNNHLYDRLRDQS